MTLRGREVADGDPAKDEKFLAYSGQGGRLLVFCAPTELEVLHGSEYVVCDGTFEMCPDTAYQLYTLHGFSAGEALPLVYALLPNKTHDTYVEMFAAVRSALNATFGTSCGRAHRFLIDYEVAAIQAIQQVFPEAVVKGCCFHFRQAVLRRVQQEGLKTVYEDKDSAGRQWIRRLMSMTMLPAFAVSHAWQWLQHPPLTGDTVTDGKLQALAEYFKRTWISGQFPPSLWSHYDNLGPRTTNHAEGFHSSLNARFGLPHPSLRSFLHWLQQMQFEVHCRILQLESGRPPKRRRQCYADNDDRMWSAKLHYGTQLGRIFCYLFPHPQAWNEHRVATDSYLGHCSYLLGC